MSAVLDSGRDLATLRYYLRLWANYERSWRHDLGAPHAVPYASQIKGCVAYADEGDEADENYSPLDRKVLDGITVAVNDLPALQRSAVRLVYLREVGPAVYGSGRMSMQEAKRLCEVAEWKILARVRGDF